MLAEHWKVVALCIFVGLILLCFLGTTMRRQMKKGLIVLLVIAGIGAGYYFLTGKSPADIPAAIDSYFNSPRAPEEATHKYYRDPDEQLKEFKN